MAISDDLLDAILHQESGGDPNAVNKRTGAAGIAQIMEATARQPGFGVTPISAKDRFNPKKAIPFARSYLNALSEKYKGNVAHTLAAYNWGPGNVDKWLKSGATFDRLPDETRNYVVNILGNRGNAPPQPEVRGFIRREGDGTDLSNVPAENLDEISKILGAQETRRTKAAKAAQAEQARAQARRQVFLKRLANSRSSAPAPNLRPAATGSPGRIPLQAAQVAPVSAAPVDPLATQQAFAQSLLNPGTSGGLLGARNLGPTGLLSPVPLRTEVRR